MVSKPSRGIVCLIFYQFWGDGSPNAVSGLKKGLKRPPQRSYQASLTLLREKVLYRKNSVG